MIRVSGMEAARRFDRPTGLGFALCLFAASAAAAPKDLGAQPAASITPRVEFAFEFHVNLSPPVVMGETPSGRRQYIPIAGGEIAGPRLVGEVLSGGWDYQLALANGCSWLSADYFIRAVDGTVIHVLNEGPSCNVAGERSLFHPRFEAPKGPHDWLSRGTFVATLEVERADSPTPAGPPQAPRAIRLKIFQVK
jgi:uncharacterized protein DUF3237